MARELDGRLVDFIVTGRTSLGGSVADLDKGASSSAPAFGVVTAAGHAAQVIAVAGGAHAIDESARGATFVFSSSGQTSVQLPSASVGKWFTFIVGAGVDTALTVSTPSTDSAGVYGGVVVGNCVPPALFASGEESFEFLSNAVRGDRVSLASDGGNWYIADGVVSMNGALRFF